MSSEARASRGRAPEPVLDPRGHLYPVSMAEPGSMGRTGFWRTQRPVVDPVKCTGCYLCWLYCPEDVIEMREKAGPRGQDIPVIDYEYCKGCGVCAVACPVNAIQMVDEEQFILRQLRNGGGDS